MDCIGGKVSDGNVIAYDTWNAEVLHKEYKGRFDVKKVFLNPFLMRVSVYLKIPRRLLEIVTDFPF